jgi:hypothetical protein
VGVTVVAVFFSVLLSAMALEPEDCDYWRRWLSWLRYTGFRIVLAAVPFLMAVFGSMSFAHADDWRVQLLQGIGVAAGVAAALRATLSRKHIRHVNTRQVNREVSSALSWLYERCCLRLDKAAERNVGREMSKYRKRGFQHADELVALAEEVVGLLNIERVDARTKPERDKAGETCQQIRDCISVVGDRLAKDAQRRNATLELAERLSKELVARRWSRVVSHQADGGPVKGEQVEEAL